jgi:hypothetical protein
LSNVVAIAAGGYHSLALKSDGTVVGWGYNDEGEATPPEGLSNVVAIAAGGYHSLALKSDGTVVGWGYNDEGEATPPEGLSNVVAIAAGYSFSLAITCAPATPSALAATVITWDRIDLSWIDNSYNEDGFKIERATSPAGLWSEIASVGSDVTTWSDTTVTCDVIYYYRVRAYQSAAGSPYSDIVNANTATADGDGDGVPDCWMLSYFGHPTGQAADNSRASDDPDGDGQNNLAEFLAGTNPTNSASAFRITGIEQEGDDIRVTWSAGAGRTNVVQAASYLDGGYSNISENIVVQGSGDTTTNYLDIGGATNAPSRFYRIRLVP